MMMTNLSSPRRRARSGQFVVIYMMGFFTMCILAFATLAVGQVVVRKQWAQMIADASAFAGASKQAEGLNTISEITDTQLTILNAVQFYDRAIPGYLMGWLDCWLSYWLVNGKYQDIQDAHQNVQDFVFNPLSWAVDGINLAYPELSYFAAKEVCDDNIQAFFPNEGADRFNYPKIPYANGGAMFGLAKLTPSFGDTVAWHYVATDLGPCWWFLCAGPACTAASLLSCDISGVAGLYGNQPHSLQPSPPESSFTFENVLKVMDDTNETTFLWWVKVPAVKPILGFQKPLGAIPDIIAIARGKPYGGHIGWGDGGNSEQDEWPNRNFLPPATWGVWWDWDRSPEQTYKAKLVPVLPIRVISDTLPLGGPVGELLLDVGGSKYRTVLEFVGIAH